MDILTSDQSLVLGDIFLERYIHLSRNDAELEVSNYFYFNNKTKKQQISYRDSCRVMFLDTCIYDKPDYDVTYAYSDCSLFQKFDGKFFIAKCHVRPYGGGESLVAELEKDYFEKSNPPGFMRFLVEKRVVNQQRAQELINSRDFTNLFGKRLITFYSQQYLYGDYQVLFYYSKGNKENLKQEKENYEVRFSKCHDKDILLKHLHHEYDKAQKCIDTGKWIDMTFEEHMELCTKQKMDYIEKTRRYNEPGT